MEGEGRTHTHQGGEHIWHQMLCSLWKREEDLDLAFIFKGGSSSPGQHIWEQRSKNGINKCSADFQVFPGMPWARGTGWEYGRGDLKQLTSRPPCWLLQRWLLTFWDPSRSSLKKGSWGLFKTKAVLKPLTGRAGFNRPPSRTSLCAQCELLNHSDLSFLFPNMGRTSHRLEDVVRTRRDRWSVPGLELVQKWERSGLLHREQHASLPSWQSICPLSLPFP